MKKDLPSNLGKKLATLIHTNIMEDLKPMKIKAETTLGTISLYKESGLIELPEMAPGTAVYSWQNGKNIKVCIIDADGENLICVRFFPEKDIATVVE